VKWIVVWVIASDAYGGRWRIGNDISINDVGSIENVFRPSSRICG
jgi:hypothetical protein